MKSVRIFVILLITSLLVLVACRAPGSPATTPPASAPAPATKQATALKIKWLGQAAFLITSSGDIRIITDPYTPSSRLNYGEINESADIVTVSHEHSDHNNVAGVRGNPEVVRGTTEIKGIKFKAISSYHDASQGKERGNNTIICFEVDGVRICHLGDLGHLLSAQQVTEIGKVDILLIPVGGNYTIDANVASQTVDLLKPAVAIPMHYQTDKTTLPIAGVDEFLQGKKNVTRLDTSELGVKAGQLPAQTQIMVPKPAR